ncbi:MAG: putative DNA binding domain-containing protein [Bacteroidetes bacterium]|nr:putative DNA binding domain-containing protein [Bacteroidota bacterium]
MIIKRYVFVLFFLLMIDESVVSQTIKVAYPNNFYPYSYRDSTGKPTGFLIDWWRLWAKKTHANIEFVSGTNTECIRLVLSDSADALAGLYFDMELKDHLQYGEFILRLKSILFLENGYKPQSADQITKPVGIVRNELTEKVVKRRFPHLNLQYFKSYREMKAMIDQHVLAGFIYEYPDLRPPYKEIPPPKGYSQYLVIRADKIRPAVREGNDPMIRLLMIGAAQISDAEIQQIVDSYTFLKKQSQVPWNGLIIAFSIVLLGSVYLVFLFRFRKRNRLTFDLKEAEWHQIVSKGESDKVEFKSSLRWDYRQEKVNKALEHVIAKTISAFLNTEGGILFIGVDDAGNTIGLIPDYQTMSKKNSDGFLLALTDLVNRYLGKEFHRFISTRIIAAGAAEICMVTVNKSDSPVFVENGNEQEFFIRAPASSQPLNMREAMEYIQSHWAKKS